MTDAFVERAKQRACLAAITVCRACFMRCADQLVQNLRISLKSIQKRSQCFGVLKQSVTPLLRQCVQTFVLLIQALDSLKLMPQIVRFKAPHQFADKLHLPPSCLVLLGRLASVEDQRVFQVRVGKFNSFELFVSQLRKCFAECLQRQHVTFFRTFRGQAFRLECPVIIS